uniref:Ig-like domain-containing protein n=1 Tax=Cynoglossus semilaevis TaxID=244447 RepID=A0A3P8X4M8_CYNSE
MPPHWMVHLVLLPFLLSGVNGACSSDDNPIFLDPSEVIAEYEDEVTLTCNNTDDIQDAIFWQYGTTTSGFLEDTPFISWTLKLTDWNVTKAECMTRLDNALECSKELKITLFKNPDMVVLYSPMNDSNIAGTNYALQCDIVNVAPVQNLIVNWYRDNHLVKTDFFNETKSKLPVNESSSYEFITNKEDDGAEIRCEAFLDFGPEGPTTPHFWQTHIISVQYAPELMSRNFDVINVRRGDSVTVTCDVKGNPTPTFTWTRDTSAMAENRRSFNVSHVTADVTYICIAGNLLGHTSRAIQLLLVKDDITEAPAVATDPSEDPDVCTPVLTPSEVLVAFGHPVSIDCSAPASADGEVSWKAPSGSLSVFNYTSVSWRIQSLHDWDLKPLCSVTLKNGRRCTASPTITLYKNPDMVVLYSPMNDSNIAGTNYALQCDIVNVAPVQNLIVNWYRDNHLVKTDFFNETSELPVSESSSYEFITNKEDDGAEIRCEAFLDFGPEGPTTPPVWQTHPGKWVFPFFFFFFFFF